MDKGIISKERVKNYGEVFTPDSIVNDMLDLVSEQIPEDESYITKTFLEPACGDGQFLIRILYRKLVQVKKLPVEEREYALVKAIASIYGVDIQKDNVEKSKERMKDIILGKEVTSFDLAGKPDAKIQIDLGIDITDQLKSVIDYILEHNIIVGNTIADDDTDHNKNANLPGQVVFTVYHFNDNNKKVSLAGAYISKIKEGSDDEFGRTEEVDVMDIVNIGFIEDNEGF